MDENLKYDNPDYRKKFDKPSNKQKLCTLIRLNTITSQQVTLDLFLSTFCTWSVRNVCTIVASCFLKYLIVHELGATLCNVRQVSIQHFDTKSWQV